MTNDGRSAALSRSASTGEFRDLHRKGEPLRLLNAWDAANARVFEDAGAAAIGTTSAGVAFALGRPDGEFVTRDEIVEATRRIAQSVRIPVTADIESGHGETPAGVGETVRRVIAAGAIGINIEDASCDPSQPLRSPGDATARIAAARAAADAEIDGFFINARTDLYLQGAGEPESRPSATVQRLSAYAEAGADGAFVPGLWDLDTIESFVRATPLPLNVLAGPGGPAVSDLAKAGVARVSVGSVPSRAALGLYRRVADEFLGAGSIDEAVAGAISYADANELFAHAKS